MHLKIHCFFLSSLFNFKFGNLFDFFFRINFYLFSLFFSYIDEGRNPQLYTKDCIEKALTKNEQVKGKIDAYRKFKANMLVEMNRVFPNELTKYRAIRDRSE